MRTFREHLTQRLELQKDEVESAADLDRILVGKLIGEGELDFACALPSFGKEYEQEIIARRGERTSEEFWYREGGIDEFYRVARSYFVAERFAIKEEGIDEDGRHFILGMKEKETLKIARSPENSEDAAQGEDDSVFVAVTEKL